MANPLPVKMGISSGAVRNIPQDWDAGWFRKFITHHMQNMDIRNTIAGPGITITGTEQQPGTISVGTLSQSSVGAALYPVLAGEGATVVNDWYPYGYVERYGTNTTPGTTDMSTAFANAVAANTNVFAIYGPYVCHDVVLSGQTINSGGASFYDAPGCAFIFKLQGFNSRWLGGYIAGATHCSLGAIVFDSGNLCEASGQKVVNATTVIRFQQTYAGYGNTCTNAAISNIQGDNFSVAGVYVGPNVSNIQGHNVQMDCNTVAGGGGQIPKLGVTGFQFVGTGTTTNTGGHLFSNCTALNGQNGWSFTDTTLIKLDNCISDSLCGVAYLFAGTTSACDLGDSFAGTCAVAVQGQGTSTGNRVDALRTYGIGNIPGFGGTTWYSQASFSAPFYELVQLNTAKFSVNLDNWIASNTGSPSTAHSLSEAVAGNIELTGGILVNFNSAGNVASSVSATWIGPAGQSTTNEAATCVVNPINHYSVANIARVVMNSTNAPGATHSYTYTLRVNFGSSAITGTTGAAAFTATFSGGPVSINPGYQIDMQVVSDAAGATPSTHYGYVQLFPQPA